MSKLILMGSVIILFLFTVSGIGFSQEQEEFKYGVGFQITLPAVGLSGMVDLNEKIAAQGIMWVQMNEYSNEISLAVKGLKKFKVEDFWNSYGYGIVKLASYRNSLYEYDEDTDRYIIKSVKEKDLGLGAGLGLEWDIRSRFPKIPPLFLNLEIGMTAIVDLDNSNLKSFNTIMMGSGLHYRF